MNYPWYEIIRESSLEQGDILENCPVFLPPEDLTLEEDAENTFTWESRDVILMSQTCDLVQDREKVTEVLLCPVWAQSELQGVPHLNTPKGMEDARRGNLPGFHLLASCDVGEFQREIRVVDFRRVYSLPLLFVRRFAANSNARIRLLPPYREHMAQAFARFFMRVGLPTDIPSFVSGR